MANSLQVVLTVDALGVGVAFIQGVALVGSTRYPILKPASLVIGIGGVALNIGSIVAGSPIGMANRAISTVTTITVEAGIYSGVAAVNAVMALGALRK